MKTTQRDSFFNRVFEIAKENRDIIVLSADMGAPALDQFRNELENQFINIGIAEQNAITVSAGMALAGKKVFAYAIAPFITLRCYDQLKCVLAAMKIPVTFVGVGAGFSYDDSGPTHHTLEDLSIIRALANVTIHNITDPIMASKFADISVSFKGPNYVRLDREPLPVIYDENEDFTTGVKIFKNSRDLTIVACGNMVHTALTVSEMLEKKGLNAGVIDLYTLPINRELFLTAVSETRHVITLEEHNLNGGLGSAVCELFSDNNIAIPVKRIGLNLTEGYCYKYGGRKHIQSLYGLDPETVAETTFRFHGK